MCFNKITRTLVQVQCNINIVPVYIVTMLSARSLLSSMYRMTQHRPGARHVATTRHAMATFQVQSEEEFREKVVNGEKPTVVDFSATWCGPCKLLSPR